MAHLSSRLSAHLALGALIFLFSGCSGSDGGESWRQSRGEETDAEFHPHHHGRDAAPSPVIADAGTEMAPLPVAADAASDALPSLDTAGGETASSDTDALFDGGPASPDADGTDRGVIPPAPVTVVVLPDTQEYTYRFLDIFPAQTRWIVEQKSARNIAAVLHVGDLIYHTESEAEWAVASSSMRVLDGVVPYVIVPGNHDTESNRAGPINDHFAPVTMPWITGTMTAGQIENNYTVIDIGPQKWLILGLEFGPRDAVLTWADTVLKTYPTLPTIILTHAYLAGDVRYDYATYGASQPYYPRWYNFTPTEGINDGEDIWQKLIVSNPNVRLVLSGHLNGAGRLTSPRADSPPVHQMLSCYQWLHFNTADDRGGSGYLRTLEFDYVKKEIRVQTYSPYLDKFLTDDENQFTVSLEI